MNRNKSPWAAVLTDDKGEEVIEFGLIIILVTLASLAIFIAAGGHLQELWNVAE